MLPRLARWRTLDQIKSLLAQEKELLEHLKIGLPSATTFLYNLYPENLVMHWNRIAFLLAENQATSRNILNFLDYF